jgi:molybdenum cofactor biosynthesis enzyme MoaA
MKYFKDEMIYITNLHIDILTRKVPCPERLNVELTTYCNLKCIMCRGSQSYAKENKAYRHLKLEEFVSILNGIDLSRLKALNLAGNAESLLNPDILPILSLCRDKKIAVDLITNGMMLTPQISKQLLGSCSEIHISFGGSTKQIFESIRQGADFELVCENIRYLSELKKTNYIKYPYIWLNPILMKNNIHELPEICLFSPDR